MTLRKISILTILVLAISIMMFAAPDVKWDGKIKMTPTKPKVGDKVIFSAFFLVKGGAQRGLQIQGGVDGVVVKNKTYALAKDNLRKVIKFDWTATAGSHKAWFKIDPNNKIKDSNRANNIVEITFTVPGGGKPKPGLLPDLVVTALSSTNNSPTAGVKFIINAEIKNIGNANVSTSPEVVLEINGARLNTDHLTPPIAPGQTQKFSWDVTVANPGSDTFTVVADKDGITTESNESNNKKSITLKVSKAGGSGTKSMPGFAPGTGNVGVAKITELRAERRNIFTLEEPKPNLVIDKIEVRSGNALAGQVVHGESFTLVVTLRHIGPAQEAGSHFVNVFLNKTQTIKKSFTVVGRPIGFNLYKTIIIQNIPTKGLDPNKPLVLVKAVLDGDNSNSKSTLMGIEPPLPDLVVSKMHLKMNCLWIPGYDHLKLFKQKNNQRCVNNGDPWQGVLTITVMNIGKADTTETVRLNVNLNTDYVNGFVTTQPYIPPIAKGDSYEWKWVFTHGCLGGDISSQKYVTGISWEIDTMKEIKEQDESNNSGSRSNIEWPWLGSSIRCGRTVQFFSQ